MAQQPGGGFGGSSLSVKTAILSVAGPGEKLLISRNAQRSAIAGVIISRVQPVWVHPHFDAGLELAHPPEPEDVRRALYAYPDAKGMLLISPTDYGTSADIVGVAGVRHERGIPLIVDEAWGAHLPFHEDLPAWGMDAGADLVVTSVHKMGAVIEQSSCSTCRRPAAHWLTDVLAGYALGGAWLVLLAALRLRRDTDATARADASPAPPARRVRTRRNGSPVR